MTISVDLTPEQEEALRERARASGRDLASYIKGVLLSQPVAPEPAPGRPSTLDDLIDHDVVVSCAAEADESITIEEVLRATSRIRDSMARAVIEEERAERF